MDLSCLKPIDQDFYDRPVVEVARELIGTLLVRECPLGLALGRIVEVEAYLSKDDPACHAFRGPTRRNATMFGPAGHAYVYTIHTRYCLNAVTEAEGSGSAVLIRAIEPLAGHAIMAGRRGTARPLALARGPGRLCQALAITRELDGWNLSLGQSLWISRDPDHRTSTLLATPRIGISSATDLPLRFIDAKSRFVSLPRLGPKLALQNTNR